MQRSRRNPFGGVFGEVDRVQQEFARLFGRLGTFGTEQAAAVLPINVWEDEHGLYAEADLPGLNPTSLDVFVTEGNQLTIQGERKAPEINGASWVRQERPFGQFTRVVGLPALVDADKVEATYEHGVLRVTLPKSEAARPRKIAVRAGE